jgi:hypothetical protein
MKNYLVFFFVCMVSLTTRAQTTKNIDDGFANIKIDQTLQPIQGMLTEIKKENLWKPALSMEMINKVYMVNLSKLKTTTFFGLTISRIEVQFDEENIFEFTIFMEAPSKTNHTTFLNKVIDNYGPPEVTSLDENMVECPTWFSSITLLMVSGEGAVVTQNGKKYIYADFTQAYGG